MIMLQDLKFNFLILGLVCLILLFFIFGYFVRKIQKNIVNKGFKYQIERDWSLRVCFKN